jgi:hypothetical protein
MIITKIIESSVDLKTSDEIYSYNKKATLLEKLKKRYTNICYQSIFILDVINIIKYSKTRMVDNRLDGGASIDVMFEVRGIILNKNEVLNGCKIVQIASNAIIAEHKYAGIFLKIDQKLPSFSVSQIIKKGQTIPISVDSIMFNPGTSQMTIIGSPYVPTPHTNVYHNITNEMTQSEVEKLKLLIADFNKELALHEKISKNKPYEIFKDIVYPYKTNQKFETSQLGSKFSTLKVNIEDLAHISDGCLLYPSDLNKLDSLDKFIYHAKDYVKIDNLTIVDARAYTALSYMILQRIYYLQGLRGIYEEYDTPEKNQDMITYWKVCQSIKQ